MYRLPCAYVPKYIRTVRRRSDIGVLFIGYEHELTFILFENNCLDGEPARSKYHTLDKVT